MAMPLLLSLAIEAAGKACIEILEVYNSGDFQTESKGDHSPVTIADKRAHAVITAVLESSHLPILSEEDKSIPYEERKLWESFWMVDPLDGTKEFLKRNGEFTVNIAIIKQQQPVLGVVAIPVTGEIFFAMKGEGAFVNRGGSISPLTLRAANDLHQKGIRVVASRSHMSDDTLSFIQSLQEPELLSKGSSLKFLLLAEGKADVYPRFAPTMEWDTAAAHAIVNEVGFSVLQKETRLPLLYNKPELVNPFFICG